MASRTRARVPSLTLGLPLSTRETVPSPTPAWAATSAIVGIELPPESFDLRPWKRFLVVMEALPRQVTNVSPARGSCQRSGSAPS